MKTSGLTAAFLLVLACGSATAGGLYDAVNRLRSGVGPCVTSGSRAERPPRRLPKSALERIARALSRVKLFKQTEM